MLAASQPLLPLVAKMVAAGVVFWVAHKLWINAGRSDGQQGGVTPGNVFVTTLLNPKALVFAFAIFPGVGPIDRLPYCSIFIVLAGATGLAWTGVGGLAARRAIGWLQAARVERATAAVLAAFAAALVVQVTFGLFASPA